MDFSNRVGWEIKSFFIAILIIIPIFGAVKGYLNQSFICNKAKDICYYTTFGIIRNSEEIKISQLDGIMVKTEQITVTRGHKYHRRHEEKTTYMPTLITKNGKTYPFYKSPTQNQAKAEQDKKDFTTFLKGSSNNLKLKNIDNYNG